MLLYYVIAVGALLAIFVASLLTNPFSRITIVRKPYVAKLTEKTIVAINNNHRIVVRNNPWWQAFAWVKSGVHVMESRYLNSPRSKGKTIAAIIKDIHKLRYDTDKLLLISGDHFSGLYVRNLGVFYYPLLDGHITSSAKDWYNRQVIYLETVAFALGVFEKRRQLTTTIVSTGAYGVTCVNFYAYPSDSLYGMLYALAVMSGKEIPRAYDYSGADYVLDTAAAATALLSEYKPTLRQLYADYKQTVYDERTGLIRTDIHLSGAKDITRRSSAFYDNVILWKTTQLAMKLGLIKRDTAWLAVYKQRILKTFWLPKAGHFLEDLSAEGLAGAYYSSDWLAVLFTGFLDPANKQEQSYYTSSLDYIDKHAVDRPFALKYQQERRAHRQFLAVRLAVASYGGDAIWSFWGMEYIKTLLLLYRSTRQQRYLEKADYHIAKYKQVMLRDGGFPEVFNADGKLLQTPLYRSIRQTGWVIGFEQVLAIRADIARH
jgi:hypothetical protein